MRILNVTQTYAPFLEFGGPPVKVRALSEALVRRGHQVTVLTADWGLEARLRGELHSSGTTRLPVPAVSRSFPTSSSPSGCSCQLSGVSGGSGCIIAFSVAPCSGDRAFWL